MARLRTLNLHSRASRRELPCIYRALDFVESVCQRRADEQSESGCVFYVSGWVWPGPIDTDLNPAAGDWATPQKAATALDRYGSVDEVAALVSFVAGPESSYITGANLTVDGGTNA